MSLQVFQAGLSWRLVLARRDAFRRAFRGWKIDEVASLTEDDVDRLLDDSSIIRNRRKVEACVENARIAQALRSDHGGFCHWFDDVLAGDDLAALQSVLRKTLRKTFKFMGPEVARMWFMACGRVPAH